MDKQCYSQSNIEKRNFEEETQARFSLKLETICSLAKQDLTKSKDKKHESTATTGSHNTHNTKYLNPQPTGALSLPFFRASSKVCRPNIDQCATEKSVEARQPERDVFGDHQSNIHDRSLLLPATKLTSSRRNSADCSRIRLTPGRHDLPHPSNLRSKKRKAEANAHQPSGFNINNHLTQLKKKCQLTARDRCNSFSSVSGVRVKKDINQADISPRNSAVANRYYCSYAGAERPPNGSFTARQISPNLWTQIGAKDQKVQGASRPSICYSEKVAQGEAVERVTEDSSSIAATQSSLPEHRREE